jgi:hypothetical protein
MTESAAENLFWELSYVALNRKYNEEALRTAYESEILDDEDRQVLNRYLKGDQIPMDHIRLQVIAIKLKGQTA